MSDKTEAQPEALRVAAWLINAPFKTTHGDMLIGGRELRRQHAEVERLTAALKKANDQTEHFEREWYLRGDEIEQLKAQLSARQAAPDGLLALEQDAHSIFNDPPSCTSQEVRDVIEWYAASVRVALSVAPPPPEREPLTDEQIAQAAVNAGMTPIYDKPKILMVNALGSSVPFTWLKAFAHGIQGEGNES